MKSSTTTPRKCRPAKRPHDSRPRNPKAARATQLLHAGAPALPEDPGHALWKRDFTGASGLVSFAFKEEDASAAHAFVDALKYFGIGASWGGYESLAIIAAPERLQEHINGLHQLAAGRPAPAFKVAGFIFLMRAHVKTIERTLRGFGLKE